MKSRFCIVIPCGSAKLEKPARARDLYTGSYFRAALAFAENVSAAPGPLKGAEIRILSAKFGLVKLDDALEPYDSRMGSASQETSVSEIKAQLLQERDGQSITLNGPEFLLVGGQAYYDIFRLAVQVSDGLSGPLRVIWFRDWIGSDKAGRPGLGHQIKMLRLAAGRAKARPRRDWRLALPALANVLQLRIQRWAEIAGVVQVLGDLSNWITIARTLPVKFRASEQNQALRLLSSGIQQVEELLLVMRDRRGRVTLEELHMVALAIVNQYSGRGNRFEDPEEFRSFAQLIAEQNMAKHRAARAALANAYRKRRDEERSLASMLEKFQDLIEACGGDLEEARRLTLRHMPPLLRAQVRRLVT